jgi:hypothetical protein
MSAAPRNSAIARLRSGQKLVTPERRILLFGDSHAHAVQTAITKRLGKGKSSHVVAYRLLKNKKGVRVGNSTLDDFLALVRDAGPEDLVVSMIGGNQHAVYSTIQHPQPFDFFNAERDPVEGGVEIIPFRALKDVFARGLRNGDARSLEAIRKATAGRVIHVIPPPPKADSEHITKHHETLFAKDIPDRGVSPAMLRLKFWKLQTQLLSKMCTKLGIDVLMPPDRAVDPLGFLRPEFYAHDATHGNWRYGERIIRQLEKIHPEMPPEQDLQ